MKIVNNSKLPESIYNFLLQDFYDGEKNGISYSATELLKPTQEIILTRRHWNEIEVDAADRIWSLFGQAVHSVLEAEKDVEPIERLYAELDGYKISGKFDRLKNNTLYDFKVTSVWTIAYGSRVEEWKDQLSIYKWLYWKSKGKELNIVGKIVAILRDWADRDKEKKNYPQSPIVEVEIILKTIAETEKMLKDKLVALEKALPLDADMPECSDHDRWWNEKKQAYMKCEKYCSAYKFCKQANEIFSEPILINGTIKA